MTTDGPVREINSSSELGIDIGFSKRSTVVNDEKNGFPTEYIRYTIVVNNNRYDVVD